MSAPARRRRTRGQAPGMALSRRVAAASGVDWRADMDALAEVLAPLGPAVTGLFERERRRAAARVAEKAACEAARSAGRETADVTVASPHGEGVDRVRRVVDPLDKLAAHGAIDVRERAAAERYRAAFDRVLGLPGQLDMSRVRAGGRVCYGEAVSSAAADLADAHRILGAFAWVIERVVGRGESLSDLAADLGEAEDLRNRKRWLSRTLQMSLRELAAAWFPERARGMGAWRAEDGRPSASPAERIERARVAHCTRQAVYYRE